MNSFHNYADWFLLVVFTKGCITVLLSKSLKLTDVNDLTSLLVKGATCLKNEIKQVKIIP